MAEMQPEFVIMAAARVGGIMANATYPADFIADNLSIALNVIEAAHEAGVGSRGRLVFLGSSCIYPKLAPQPMSEEHILTGALEPTNAPYAIAKIAGVALAESFHRQHGDDFISLMPTNLYGPGDNFDLETSHVLPALIRKIHEAAQSGGTVTLWGSGSPRREFLFSDDLADAVLFMLEQPEEAVRAVAPDGLINVGVGEDISIRDLAKLVSEVLGVNPHIEWDSTRPDGTPRKLLDVSRARALGWEASTPLREGIRTTYDWYRKSDVDSVTA